MPVKRLTDLDAADVGKLGRGEMARPAQIRLSGDGLNRLMNSKQLALGDIKVRILQMPAVLQSHVQLGAAGDGDFQAHACNLAFSRMRSSTEAS